MSNSTKKLRRKLNKKVLSGKMTVTDARERLGRHLSQKAAKKSIVAANKADKARGVQLEAARLYNSEVLGMLGKRAKPVRELGRADESLIREMAYQAGRTADPVERESLNAAIRKLRGV